jgi:hypothetical protein
LLVVELKDESGGIEDKIAVLASDPRRPKVGLSGMHGELGSAMPLSKKMGISPVRSRCATLSVSQIGDGGERVARH